VLKKSWLHIKRRWFPYLFAYSAKMAIRVLLKTCKIRIRGLEDFVKTAETSPCILMLWHNRLVLVSEILNSHAAQFIYTAFISKSRDGDPLAHLAESYSSGRVLRVPHHARHLALNQMMEAIKSRKEIMIVTPDGPRGPKGIVKPGIALAAKETGANIFPFSWSAKRFWQLKTWDQMSIPKPFTTIDVMFGTPLIISKETEGRFESEVDLLKNALDALSST
jgi:lysophospholipid acyltransferase (LPLAT)-like uncharacterized protein